MTTAPSDPAPALAMPAAAGLPPATPLAPAGGLAERLASVAGASAAPWPLQMPPLPAQQGPLP